ncbi:hypothetical protein KM176_18500 [Pseudooceanicola sp. CBS1P-1]|uniref:Magnesium transporter MgtE intracellular domain-containing protein n=1 Tax=Pseudooceanicola albus TaxID=2692189 RepID=A0A6L7G831_9RHOB|nr:MULTISPECIES: hypothetical protein [Pseudooceanicola]MBT9385868.1 hypothetical protein [Pseudooceanicola endophyticus]MXN20099.1 hypothetical protein [Pseudooceanicola albus]
MAKTRAKPAAKGAGKIKPARRPKRRARSPLTMIALLLLTSAGLRIAMHADDVMALEPGDHAAPAEGAPAGCTPGPDVEAMLGAFKERETRLDQREAQIRDRMNALAIADEEIQKKLVQLEEAEERLRDTLALADGAAEKDITRLTSVYEAMKPKDAAALFEQMAPEFAAGFIARMQPPAAAAIMTGLSSERAYSISAILAGRNSSVPKE